MSMPVVREGVCTDCGGCVGVCPVDAIDLHWGAVKVLPSCVECDLCIRVCPPGALAHEER